GRVAADTRGIGRAQRVGLPGVAAFGRGMERAQAMGLRGALGQALERGAPVLGICLGMQILFEEGEEDGHRNGLGLLPGRVTRIPSGVQVPHIGWQRLRQMGATPLLDDRRAPWTYFANSFRCEAPQVVLSAVAYYTGVSVAGDVVRST